MTEDALSLEEVMSRRFELAEEIAIIQGKHKAELEPHHEEMALCETFIKDTMNTGNLQNVKTTSGHMAYFSTKDSCAVRDFDAVVAHILEHNAFNLLNKAVNKTAVKEYIDENKVPPPGVEYSTYRDLNWKRGKG